MIRVAINNIVIQVFVIQVQVLSNLMAPPDSNASPYCKPHFVLDRYAQLTFTRITKDFPHDRFIIVSQFCHLSITPQHCCQGFFTQHKVAAGFNHVHSNIHQRL